MKTLINTTGEQLCNTATEFLKTNEINMISICTDDVPSTIGKRKGLVSRLEAEACLLFIVLHRENVVAKILATMILLPFFKQSFQLLTK